VAYVNTESILSKIPEYQNAQQEIERISQQWEAELEKKYAAIEKMYTDFVAQEVLLPEDVRQERQEAIFAAEREAKEYREKKFGYEGELFQQQETRMNPIQDKVFKAIEQVAKRKRYDFVFDKAGEVTWLYTNAIYDLTPTVLEELDIEVDGTSGN
ncbi:MAG: OmpH family outer membrane protein, partial [Bacteroidota bacterium]